MKSTGQQLPERIKINKIVCKTMTTYLNVKINLNLKIPQFSVFDGFVGSQQFHVEQPPPPPPPQAATRPVATTKAVAFTTLLNFGDR